MIEFITQQSFWRESAMWLLWACLWFTVVVCSVGAFTNKGLSQRLECLFISATSGGSLYVMSHMASLIVLGGGV